MGTNDTKVHSRDAQFPQVLTPCAVWRAAAVASLELPRRAQQLLAATHDLQVVLH